MSTEPPHFNATKMHIRMYGSAAASKALVCADEYMSGSFSS
jgi:hypothetical protein